MLAGAAGLEVVLAKAQQSGCWLQAHILTPPTPKRAPSRARQMRGANAECDDMVWRIDVGMSSGVLDAPVSILEIVQDASGEAQCKVITEGETLSSFDEREAAVDL